jgi:hypothetical protein
MQVHEGLRAGEGAGGGFIGALHPSVRMQSDPVMGKGARSVDAGRPLLRQPAGPVAGKLQCYPAAA